MTWPLTETLVRVKPYLPEPLVSAQICAYLQSVAASLPNRLSAHYFETRLASAATQIDFSTCVAAAARQKCLIEPQSSLLKNPLWQRVNNFLGYWANPAAPLAKQVPLIWLEFDGVDALSPEMPLPGVNICLDAGYLVRQIAPPSGKQSYQPFIETVLECLLGQPLPAQTRQNLKRCFTLLPPGGKIIYISAMLPREPVTVKLNGFIPKNRLIAYLEQIDWPGSVVEIKKLLASYCTSLEQLRIDLTVGEHIASRVGFEFFSKGSTQPEAERPLLLNKLVKDGLCTPEKAEALQGWAGYSSELFQHQGWATKLNRTWYTKIVYQTGQALEAKGYLGFMPTFFSLFEESDNLQK